MHYDISIPEGGDCVPVAASVLIEYGFLYESILARIKRCRNSHVGEKERKQQLKQEKDRFL